MYPYKSAISALKKEPAMEKKLIHKELSKDIIGAAMEVLNEFKPGLNEKLYESD